VAYIRPIRPPDIHVDRLFYSDSFHILFRPLAPLLLELAERNSTKTGHMARSDCDLKMHVRNLGYPFPLQIGGPNPTFFDDFTT